jgi:8-oxo-dGTP pyrophosphatase MutT (NUDIX family)
MKPFTSSASSLPSLANINKRYIRYFENRRRWQRVWAGDLVRYHTTRPHLYQTPKRTVNGVISARESPILAHNTSAMPKGTRSSSLGPGAPAKGKTPPEPRPSSSIILLSPTNQVLLLHRVKTSTSFASAHVFPGGNISEFHDGDVPPPGDAKRHEDSLAYRLGAIRETFEESGILLAREGSKDGPLLNLPTSERDKARKDIYENGISFGKWLESVGGIADTGK